MAHVLFENVSLEYPVYNVTGSSLRHKLVNISTGGKIAKSANQKTVVKALSNINFQILNGDRVGILGHNGAGKTTLLRCISGIYQPTSGKVIRSENPTPLIELGAGLEPELSGYDNIKRLILLYNIPTRDISKTIIEIENFTSLGNFLSLPVRTYSSGMIIRLMFAIATSSNPNILVMDEFFGVGDEEFRQKSEDRLLEKINNASILFFASHSEDLLKKYCNRFFKLEHGKLEEVKL